MAGWIKLHRKILDNPIFQKAELFQLFTYCLLRANHGEKKIIWNGKEELLEKGCFITGRKVIAEDLKQTESSIYRRLKVLQDLQMITLKSNNRFSVINVLNYCIYQGEDLENEQQVNNKRTTSEQQANTDKNVKNDKNEKNIPIQEIIDQFNIICASLPKVQMVTDTRKKTIAKYWKQHNQIEWFIDFFERVEESDLLAGRKGAWKATFDWIFKPVNFVKIQEGNYVNRQPVQQQSKFEQQSAELDKAVKMINATRNGRQGNQEIPLKLSQQQY